MARLYSILMMNFNHQLTIKLPPIIRNSPYAGEYLQTHLNRLLEALTRLEDGKRFTVATEPAASNWLHNLTMIGLDCK